LPFDPSRAGQAKLRETTEISILKDNSKMEYDL